MNGPHGVCPHTNSYQRKTEIHTPFWSDVSPWMTSCPVERSSFRYLHLANLMSRFPQLPGFSATSLPSMLRSWSLATWEQTIAPIKTPNGAPQIRLLLHPKTGPLVLVLLQATWPMLCKSTVSWPQNATKTRRQTQGSFMPGRIKAPCGGSTSRRVVAARGIRAWPFYAIHC